MRDILTGIAVIVILVLTTVLVAPYFVDWNGQREFLEARLSAALGQKVTIGGDIDLKILPTPYLVLDQVVVGSDEGAVRIGIHHVDLELSVAPLLHGAFDIVEARLQEPTIRIGLQPDRTIPLLPTAPAFQADVHFDRIQVSDGTVAISDPTSGRTFTFDHIDLDADAGSFVGPFKVAGAGGLPDQRTRFRLSTAAPEKGRARTRLTVEETASHPAAELDGTIDLTTKDVASPQRFDGHLVLSGHLTGLADEPPSWSLSGPIQADPHGAKVDDGELRLGSEDAGLTLQASLKARFDDKPAMTVALAAKQIDFDRLSGAPVDSVKPPPPRLPDLATVRQVFAAINPPLATSVDLAVDNATYGGEALSGIKARFGLGVSSTQPLAISANGPAGSRLAIDGTLSPTAYMPFSGNIDVEAENLGRAVAWLSTVAPGLPWHGPDVPFASLHVKGPVVAGNDRVDSEKLAITLDRSILAGPAHVVLGQDAVPTRLSMDLSAEDLDIDGLPSLDAARATLSGLDLDLKMQASSLKVASLGYGSLATGPFNLAIIKAGRRIDLTSFRVQNIGEANLSATGRLDAAETALTFDVDAKRLDGAAALAQQLFPGVVAEALAARVSSLVPAKLQIQTASGSAGAGGATRFKLAGTLGATHVEASLTPGDGEDTTASLAGFLQASDGGVLLRQLVAGDTAVSGLGPSEIRFSATGVGTSPLDAEISATLGTTQMGVKGHIKALALPLSGSGMATIRSRTIGPVLEAVKLGSSDSLRTPVDLAAAVTLDDDGASASDIKGRVGSVPIAGTLVYKKPEGDQPALTGSLAVDHLSLSDVAALVLGSTQHATATPWSPEPFKGGLREPPRTAIAVKAAEFDLGRGQVAEQASFDLKLDPNALRIDRFSAKLKDGTIAGRTLIRRDGGQATVEGQLALGGRRLEEGAFSAQLDTTLDFAGSGASPAGVVANLAGSGNATAARLAVKHADPSALEHVFKDVESDALAVDQDTIVRAYDDAAGNAIELGTQRFTLGLASGVLRFKQMDTPTAANAPFASRIEGNYDIGRARLDGRLEETLLSLPTNWSGAPPAITIEFAGSPGQLTRSVDVGNFLNAVAARALARETARIDAYELDIRERSFFNARLQVEKRHEEDKKAEAERKAKIEAARLEHARQEEAARNMRDKSDGPGAGARDDRTTQENPARPPARPKTPTPDAARPPSAADPSTMGRY